MPPAFLANHAGNFTTGWVEAVNPQPFLDADIWPHRTFLTRTSTVTPENRVIYCLGAAEVITHTSFPTGLDDLKSNGKSMKSTEAAVFGNRVCVNLEGGKVHFFQIVLQRQPSVITSPGTEMVLIWGSNSHINLNPEEKGFACGMGKWLGLAMDVHEFVAFTL
jgi:hypothetical protein